jgi:hypothetical protein
VIGLPCNNQQKKEILTQCDPLNSTPSFRPSPGSACCVAVRKVPGSNMDCIASLLTRADKAIYSAAKIVGLKDACHLPLQPHQQVKFFLSLDIS